MLYISSKTECFSYKSECGMMHIKPFKEELAWATYKPLRVISNIMLFKEAIPVRNYRIEQF